MSLIHYSIAELPEKGDTLVVRNVSRYSDEIYTCSASNGHGSPDHHEIRIRVRCMFFIYIYISNLFAVNCYLCRCIRIHSMYL